MVEDSEKIQPQVPCLFYQKKDGVGSGVLSVKAEVKGKGGRGIDDGEKNGF